MICAFLCLIIFQLPKKSACGQQEILRSRTESHNDNAKLWGKYKFKPTQRAMKRLAHPAQVSCVRRGH